MDNEKDFNDAEELVPHIRHSSISAIIVSIFLSGIVFGGIGYWYGNARQITWPDESNLPLTDFPSNPDETVIPSAISAGQTAISSAVVSATPIPVATTTTTTLPADTTVIIN